MKINNSKGEGGKILFKIYVFFNQAENKQEKWNLFWKSGINSKDLIIQCEC